MMQLFKSIHWLSDPQEFNPNLVPGIRFGFEGIGYSPSNTLHRVHQVHGIEIVEADSRCVDQAKLPAADGLWTSSGNRRIGIKTADCLPIILLDKKARVVAALHAGWRGLAAGILQLGIDRLLRLGCRPDDLFVLVGPSISLPSYQVGPEVVDAFWQSSAGDLSHSDLSFALYKSEADRWHIDLGGIAAMIAARRQVSPEQIFVMRSCTFANPQQWNSYRREGRVIASNWSWVEMTGQA